MRIGVCFFNCYFTVLYWLLEVSTAVLLLVHHSQFYYSLSEFAYVYESGSVIFGNYYCFIIVWKIVSYYYCLSYWNWILQEIASQSTGSFYLTGNTN